MSHELPKDVQSWKTKTKRAGPKAVGRLLNHLRDIEARPHASRHVKDDRTPRANPIPLSGSTAREDDFYAMRAIVKKKVSPDTEMKVLQDSGYVDEESWNKALVALGLRMGGDGLVPAVDDDEGTAATRPQSLSRTPTTSHHSATAAVTASTGGYGLQTPAARVGSDPSAIPPQAPKKDIPK